MDTIRQERTNIIGTNERLQSKSDKDMVDPSPKGRAIRNGLLAGVIMALYVFLIEASADPETISFLRPISYLFMLIVFYQAIKRYKNDLLTGRIFKRGAVLGIYMSAVTAIALVGVLIALELVFYDMELNLFTREVDTFNEVIIFDWILLFQTFVFGIIATFISLQGLKGPRRAR
ncbi:MAG: DUF4199 domain-containing protein [Bacteroidota bacterium]